MNIFNTLCFGKSYLKITASHWQFPLLVHVLCLLLQNMSIFFSEGSPLSVLLIPPFALPLHLSMSRVFIISKEHPQSALELFSHPSTLISFNPSNFPFLCLLVLWSTWYYWSLPPIQIPSASQCPHTVLSSDQDSAPSQCSSGFPPGVVIFAHPACGEPPRLCLSATFPSDNLSCIHSFNCHLLNSTGLHLQSQPQP